MKQLILGLLLLGPVVSQAVTSFTYTLAKNGTTSAGVYRDNTLVRTLWFNEPRTTGAHTNSWDNKDDDGNVVAPGNYEIRVLVHNMEYRWDGLVGNNSRDMSGTAIHKGMYPIRDITITGTKAFYTSGYNEGMYDFHRFDTREPQVRLNNWTWVRDTRTAPKFIKIWDCYGPVWSFATTDGTNVYWACPAGWNNATNWSVAPGYVVVNRVSDDSQSDAFTNGKELFFLGTPYVYPRGIQVGTQAGLSGLAVQPTGKLLAAAVAPENKVYLIDKLSGDVSGNFAVTQPKRMVFQGNDQLWIAAGTNVYCYSLSNSPPTLLKTFAGFSNALAVAVSPIADLVIVADGGGSMQLKAFTTEGKPVWTYGKPGGQPQHGPAVTDDKLWFFVESVHATGERKGEDTFITFQPDGTFWVGDGMNARTLHFSAGRKPRVIDRIAMQPMCYAISLDQNNPRRVFRNFLEFEVDYRKSLGPNNGSWKLVNNWAAKRPSWSKVAADDSTAALGNVTTLKNGRTYACLYHHETDPSGADLIRGSEIVELTKQGLRATGQLSRGNLQADGSLFRTASGSANGSFETGDIAGWHIWTSGPSATWSATVQQTPHQATDGKHYLQLRAVGATNSGAVAVSFGKGFSAELTQGQTYTFEFDVLNQTNGFDVLINDFVVADTKQAVTGSAHAASPPVLHADGAWHSYSLTIALPPSTTGRLVDLRMSFLKHNPVAGNTYEASIDNLKLTTATGQVVIDRGSERWYRSPLTGFNRQGNPVWGPETLLAALEQLPGTRYPSIASSLLSSRGVIVCYEPGRRDIRHLGAIYPGGTNWAWTAFPSIKTEYLRYPTPGKYPAGYYDIADHIATGGNIALVSGSHIITGYHGEGWHANQANQFMHFYDDGLFIGQFGVSGIDSNGVKWPPDYSKAGYAGNAFSPAIATHRGEIYVYLNDEWGTPLQRYHLIGAKDVRELSGTGELNSTIKLKQSPQPFWRRTVSVQ